MFSVLSLDYDWLVFLLLVDKEQFPREFDSVSWCRLGSLAYRFRQVFNTEAALQSDTAHAALVGVLVLLKVDTTAIVPLRQGWQTATRQKQHPHGYSSKRECRMFGCKAKGHRIHRQQYCARVQGRGEHVADAGFV